MLAQLQQLAESSLFGAVQAYQGPCPGGSQLLQGDVVHDVPAPAAPSAAAEAKETGASEGAGAGPTGDSASSSFGSGAAPPLTALPADYILLVRFGAREQLQAFLACPPVAALLEVRGGMTCSVLAMAETEVLAIRIAEHAEYRARAALFARFL